MYVCIKDEKQGGDQVTIFKMLKSNADKQVPAQRNLQKLRAFKHPYILTYMDSTAFEDSLVLVTESCVPLDNWIESVKDQVCMYGCKCVCECVCMSVYVYACVCMCAHVNICIDAYKSVCIYIFFIFKHTPIRA